jgi:uncharacterized membrane protein
MYNPSVQLANFWVNLPAELKIFVLSMLPVWELRGSLPLGIYYYGLHPASSFFFSFAGNFTAGVLLVCLLDILLERFIKKVQPLYKLYLKISSRASKKHRQKIELFAELGIFFVVALPLPGTGAWTGALLSQLFRLNRLKSIMSIGFGLLVCGIIMLALSTSARILTSS